MPTCCLTLLSGSSTISRTRNQNSSTSALTLQGHISLSARFRTSGRACLVRSMISSMVVVSLHSLRASFISRLLSFLYKSCKYNINVHTHSLGCGSCTPHLDVQFLGWVLEVGPQPTYMSAEADYIFHCLFTYANFWKKIWPQLTYVTSWILANFCYLCSFIEVE